LKQRKSWQKLEQELAYFRVSGNLIWTYFVRLPHLFIIFIGPWEVVQKLDLEEDLLKLTELRRTEDLGISRGHILGIATTDSLSSLSVFLSLP
jgi:hypothetical protein